jgi:hypothetical protein
MTRTETPNPAPEPEERPAATARPLVRDLLACGFAERILLLTDGESGSGLDLEIGSQVAERKGSTRLVCLPEAAADAGRALAAAIAEDLPDAIVNRSRHGIASWRCVREALEGGSRLLELPGLDDEALERCLAGIDTAALRWDALALIRRIERAERLSVELGSGTWSFDLPKARRLVGGPSDFLAPPLLRGGIASLPGAVAVPIGDGTLLLGLHPSARHDGTELERIRVLGTATRLDRSGRAIEPPTAATVALDGEPVAAAVPGRRRGRMARTLDAAVRMLAPRPFRSFTAEGGRIAIAGPLAAQAAWLRGLTGRSVGRIERSDSFRVGGLRRRLHPDDVVIAALGGPRSRLERIGGREAGWFEVPTYPRMVVPLGPLREKGLEAFTAASESAKEPLRYIRTKRLGWRTVTADPESVRRFETRYHVPTMVDRHGPEAAIRPPAGLIEECGRAELLEIIHEGQAVGMSLFRPTSPRAELLQIGVLDGDERWLKMRILSLCYALPALQCAQRAIDSYDLGRSPPFPWHPVLNFKSKWGAAVDPGPATERLLVRLPAASPATWHLLSRSGLVAVRRDGRAVAIVAVDGSSDLERVREVALAGLAEIVVVHEGIDPPAVTAALECVRNPRPVRFVPRADLDRLAAIVG